MPRTKRETKLIAGIKHVRLTCNTCKLPVWTQAKNADAAQRYVSLTCLMPRFHGQQLGLTPGNRPLNSEKEYHG